MVVHLEKMEVVISIKNANASESTFKVGFISNFRIVNTDHGQLWLGGAGVSGKGVVGKNTCFM